MKRFTKLLLLFTLIGVMSGGCELLQNSIKFNEDYSVTFTINASEDLVHELTAQTINTNIQQLLDDNGLNTDKLKSATLVEVRVEIETGSSEINFDKVVDGEIHLKYGTTEIKAAWWNTSTGLGKTIAYLDHTSNNLKDLVLASSFTAGGWIEMNAPTVGTSYVTVYLVFELDGKLIGKA